MQADLLRVAPGLHSSGNQLADLVQLYSGDVELADRVLRAGITPWTLCQAVPFVENDGDKLLLAHKQLLCSLAGLPQRAHLTAPATEPAPVAEPVPLPALRSTRYLRGKRLRISLLSAKPQFGTADDGRIQCNRCLAPIDVETDAQLAALVHRSTWHELHWKTFFCTACRERARCVDTARTAVCRSCYGANGLQWIPLRFARADDPTQPRMLPLCTACLERPPVRSQLATVRLRQKVNAMQ